ncbi:MAG: methyltransferase domain-containing protein [Candidatus Rokubacteria bacterium]|jgi:SAM-dependent methyltransferase|nr:methyltransferase domain-containing protein [Candidatus Rokubacteria bacterium]
MRPEFLEILICPECRQRFTLLEPTFGTGGAIASGTLRCACGTYPVVDSIPRILRGAAAASPAVRGEAEALKERSQRSFGYQWTRFGRMVCSFEENFLNYIAPIGEEFFYGKRGLDVGCGFGRHLINAARFGAEMVGADYSRAIDVSASNVGEMKNVDLVQADAYRLPFPPGRFDFAYCLGVLHHLPDPERAFQCVVDTVKPGGAVFIWVYSDSRRVVNACLKAVRRVTTRLPFPLVTRLSQLAALVDWAFFIGPYRLLRRWRPLRGLVEALFFSRVKMYAEYPFQVSVADWFDRLAAPIRFYYNAGHMQEWARRANLVNVRISPTGKYGWRVFGERPGA